MRLRLRGTAAVAVAFVVPLVVLLASLQSGPGFWDTADLQTVAWIAGIPYPTGFPGYVLVGWLWTHVVPLGIPAGRLNALSAVAIAGGSATVCALALLFDVLPVVAIVASWLFAFAHPVWQRAIYADAHPLGFAVAFGALALIVRWTLRGDVRALVLGILAAGAALAIDNTTVLISCGTALAACARRLPLRPTSAAFAGACALVLCAYAYLPLRSADVVARTLDPTMTLGIAPGRPYWNDHDPRTAEGFRALVGGSDFGPQDTLARLFTPDAIAATVARFGGDVTSDLPAGLALLALAGLAFASRRAPFAAAGLALAGIVPALFGGSYPVEADPYRYVFALYAVAALGVALAAGEALRRAHRMRGGAAAAIVALLALVLVRDVQRAADLRAQRVDPRPQALIDRVAAQTRDGAVIISEWNAASALAYGAYVERALGTRIVLCAGLGEHAVLYGQWMRTREVVVVALGGAPEVPGFHTRLLSAGYPSLYEVIP